MTRIQHYLIALIIMLMAVAFGYTSANAATVWTKQPGQFEQCKSAAGSTKYHCITGTGCKPDTLKCVPPVVVPPPSCQAPKTGVYPDCGQCTEPNEGIYPACTLKKCTPPKVGTYPACTDPVIPPTSLMPFVDKTKNVVPAVGTDELRIRATTENAPLSSEVAFRIPCAVSHMNNDDPMVFPGQPNATHHHTFYGNTTIKYDTDLSTLSTTGKSTCLGGGMNKSAYWHPTIIDTVTNAPIVPNGNQALFYYKKGAVPPNLITVPPKGLRMIAGNSKATSSTGTQATRYVCHWPSKGDSNGMPWQPAIPACAAGNEIQWVVTFPQCWDGKNLDSPNHQDHMAYPNGQLANRCPSTHPVAIPEISLNMWFKVGTAGTSKWRLSSDNYTFTGSNAGYSGHADWVNGWNESALTEIVRNCLNAGKDCHGHLLGDKRMMY